MTPEVRKQLEQALPASARSALEEMCCELRFTPSGEEYSAYDCDSFMAGAQAAWELAIQEPPTVRAAIARKDAEIAELKKELEGVSQILKETVEVAVPENRKRDITEATWAARMEERANAEELIREAVAKERERCVQVLMQHIDNMSASYYRKLFDR